MAADFVISQFARAVKGVDLRSTAGHCAWVRTPQLTSLVATIPRALFAWYLRLPCHLLCGSFVGLAVMTFALHAKGSRFDPGTK